MANLETLEFAYQISHSKCYMVKIECDEKEGFGKTGECVQMPRHPLGF